MKYLYIHLFALLSLFTSMNAQNAHCGRDGLKEKLETVHLTGKMFIDKHVGHGIQYYNDWQEGTLTLENNRKVPGIHIRYHALSDELLWVRDTDFQAIILEKPNIKSFTFLKDGDMPPAHFEKIDASPAGSVNKDQLFMQVLCQGKYRLLAYREVRYLSYSDEMNLAHAYYTRVNGKLERVSQNRWALYRTFPSLKKEIRKILWTKGIRLRKENDLIRLFKELNKLHSN